jgi:DNA-binding LacI/PurR family transcriptional regulator
MKVKSVTLDDVARHAGVSYQTVSRVLNQSSQVASVTRQKVEQAMVALNYVPNRMAQQLAGKRSYTLGLATTDLALQAPAQIASAIKTRASQQGYHLVISMVDSLQDSTCRAAVNELLAQRVDGVIVNVPLSTVLAQEVIQCCAPTPVLFLDVDAGAPLPSLLFDARQAARQGVEHLYQLGHRQIALICGPQNSVAAQWRCQEWCLALQEAGLAPMSCLYGDWSAASGHRLAWSLLSQSLAPSAILVANDQMALGVLRAAHELGYAIPQRLSIVGYDDTADSAYFYPPLTSVRQDFVLLGQQSVNCLLARIDGVAHSSSTEPLLATSLVVRNTSAFVDNHLTSTAELAGQLLQIASLLTKN